MALDTLVSILNTPIVFILVCIVGIALLGWFGGSFAMGGFGGFGLFVYFAINISNQLLTNVMYLLMFAILVTLAYRFGSVAVSDGGIET